MRCARGNKVFLPLLIVGSIALLALLLGFRQVQVSRKLRCELHDLRDQLTEVKEQKTSFPNSLARAERQQSLVVGSPRGSSEKYRYVASLAGQGVDAKEIAAALQMAPAEVEQLMQLSRLKQQVQK